MLLGSYREVFSFLVSCGGPTSSRAFLSVVLGENLHSILAPLRESVRLGILYFVSTSCKFDLMFCKREQEVQGLQGDIPQLEAHFHLLGNP